MTAVPVANLRPPRRLGMKILAAVLTVVCVIQLLLAFEETRTVAAARALQAGVPADRAGDWLGQARTGLNRAVNPSRPALADPGDRPMTGRFVPADATTIVTLNFEAGDIVIDDDVRLRTRPLRIAAGSDALDRTRTFAETLNAAPDAQIELRGVIADDDTPRLCGAELSVVIALLHRQAMVDVLLLSAAPGPQADPGVVCGRWRVKAG